MCDLPHLLQFLLQTLGGLEQFPNKWPRTGNIMGLEW